MPPDRFRVATALPPEGGWRCELALDRDASPPRPVSLARVPSSVSGDALALAALARGVDLAARLSHPGLPEVQGLVEVAGGLAVVSAFREGDTLRDVLDGGGPLPPALAARIVVEVARALQAVHRLADAGPQTFAHGAVRPEAVRICEDGAVLLTGLGRPSSPPPLPSDDLAALPRLLAECLAPGGAGEAPPELAPFTADVRLADTPRPAGEYADALAAAVQPAPPGALVARVDSAIPKGASARATRRRAIAQALLAEAGGEPGPLLSPPPGAPATPPVPAAAASPVRSPPPLRPALTPPPMRGAVATARSQPAPRGDGDGEGQGAPAGEGATSTAGSAVSASPAAPHPSPSPRRGASGRGGDPLGPAPTSTSPSSPTATSSPNPPVPVGPHPLDDPRLQRRLALVVGLVGLVIGFLLGR